MVLVVCSRYEWNNKRNKNKNQFSLHLWLYRQLVFRFHFVIDIFFFELQNQLQSHHKWNEFSTLIVVDCHHSEFRLNYFINLRIFRPNRIAGRIFCIYPLRIYSWCAAAIASKCFVIQLKSYDKRESLRRWMWDRHPPADVRIKNMQLIKLALAKINPKINFLIAAWARVWTVCVCVPLVSHTRHIYLLICWV